MHISNKKILWLESQMSIWVENEIISNSQKDSILNYYNETQKDAKDILPYILGSIGSLLVGLGIILILARNWDLLSRPTRLFISIVPFTIGAFLGLYGIQKNREKWFMEAIGIFIPISVIAGIALIGQTYNLDSDGRIIFIISGIISAAFSYLLKSSLGILSYLILMSFYFFTGDYYGAFIPFFIGILIIMPLTFHFKKAYSNKTYFEGRWLSEISAIFGFMVMVFISSSTGMVLEILSSFFLIIILISKLTDMLVFSRQASKLGILIIFFILTFRYMWGSSFYNIYISSFSYTNSEYEILFFALFMIVLLSVLLFIYKKNNTKWFSPILIAYVIPVIRLIYIVIPHYEWLFITLSLLFNISFFASSIYIFVSGVRKAISLDAGISGANFEMAMIIAIIAKWFFDMDVTFFARGLLFIIMGVAFLSFNFYIQKRRSLNEK